MTFSVLHLLKELVTVLLHLGRVALVWGDGSIHVRRGSGGGEETVDEERKFKDSLFTCRANWLIRKPVQSLNHFRGLRPFIVKAVHLHGDVCIAPLKRLESPSCPHFYRTAGPHAQTDPEVSCFSPQ